MTTTTKILIGAAVAVGVVVAVQYFAPSPAPAPTTTRTGFAGRLSALATSVKGFVSASSPPPSSTTEQPTARANAGGVDITSQVGTESA